MIADNQEVRVVAWTSANLIPMIIGGADPDEVVVARSNAAGKTTVKLYAVQSVSPEKLKFQFAEVAESTASVALKRAGIPRDIPAGTMLSGMWGLRTSGALRSSDQWRAPDALAWARTTTGGKEIVVAGRIIATLPAGTTLASVFPADVNHDFRDELCWTQPDEKGSTNLLSVNCTFPADSRQTVLARRFLSSGSPATCTGLRKTILLNCSPKEWKRLFDKWENPAS